MKNYNQETFLYQRYKSEIENPKTIYMIVSLCLHSIYKSTMIEAW